MVAYTVNVSSTATASMPLSLSMVAICARRLAPRETRADEQAAPLSHSNASLQQKNEINK